MGWYRHPRTQPERRLVAASLDQGIPVRGKRRIRSLPTLWEDISKSQTRSWKAHRQHQWKPLPAS